MAVSTYIGLVVVAAYKQTRFWIIIPTFRQSIAGIDIIMEISCTHRANGLTFNSIYYNK